MFIGKIKRLKINKRGNIYTTKQMSDQLFRLIQINFVCFVLITETFSVCNIL